MQADQTGDSAKLKDQFKRFRFLSLDIEISKDGGPIRAIGAVRNDTGRSLELSRGIGPKEFRKLDEFADGASFVLGHNIVAFDLPHLKAAQPDLRLLRLPAVDTLRLNPLAFPRNPYHHLVKHYQDGRLLRGQVNDPELDSRIAIEVFENQIGAFQKLQKDDPDLVTAYHWLTTPDPDKADWALNGLLTWIRSAGRPLWDETRLAIERQFETMACITHARQILGSPCGFGWTLAYTLAWISVSGDNSVIPPWVRHQFPDTGKLVRWLRNSPCSDGLCKWCRERHNARGELKRWFGFNEFRSKPTNEDGSSMQQSIAEAAMAGRHVFGILPTGAGKSLCYQLPALSRYDKTGALTVVISPLVALMKDQVSNLESKGIGSCVAINGLLSMPERSAALDQVRLGDAGILLVSPEQLRSRSVRKVLDQREIGGWVLDEAHCLSRWGHDFRPDYRYVARFTKKMAGSDPVPSLLCLTATAKPDVIDDICAHFHDKLGIGLAVFNGGADRQNLAFEVIPTSVPEKLHHLHQVLVWHLRLDVSGGAIVYCATRRQTENVAQFLQSAGMTAAHFHAGLSPESKKDAQRRFIDGELKVIVATNAFGMGIDKPDVRLVVHADIPGSLENYLQEAGRAGRDGKSAHCVLLYVKDDVERQFSMSARSRLTRRDIHGILRALRNLDRKKRLGGKVVATAGEILIGDEEKAFARDSATDDTRVRTAVSWLEEAELLTREENDVRIFPSSLRVSSVKEAGKRLEKASISRLYQDQLMRITEALIDAPADGGVTTDELMGVSGLSPDGVRAALYDLEQLGIASNDTAITAFVHEGVAKSSRKRLKAANQLETELIKHMREASPDQEKGDTSRLHLRIAAQKLRDAGVSDPLPERLWHIVRGISHDGRDEDGGTGSVAVRKLNAEIVRVTLKREWQALDKTARIRREAAGRLLEHFLDCLPSGSRGTDLLAKTTLGKLVSAIKSDALLMITVEKPTKLVDRALLWLHEQEIIRLNKGLAVFRPAMTIQLAQRERRGFSTIEFKPLEMHYKGKVLQVHVMVEYAEKGLESIGEALRFAMDYFTLSEQSSFVAGLSGGKVSSAGRPPRNLGERLSKT